MTMIFQLRAPEGYTELEVAIPDDLWDGIVTGRYWEIIFPTDLTPMPRMAIIKRATP